MDWQLASLWDEFLEFYADNNINLITVEPEILSSGEPITGCSISQNTTQLYQVNYWKDSIYEFSCSISSGDLDFKVYNYDYSGCFELIGGSYLVNPSDGSIEKCRFRLDNGCYLIIVKGKASMTEYSIETKECEAINLVCNSPHTDTAGSINGDDQGHYKQDLYFYFKIDIPYGNNTVQLSSSETANYQLTIYNAAWYFRFNLSTTSYGEVLSLIYNNTDESPITLYFEINCLEGSGSFTIEVKNPLEPTPKVKLPFLILFVFLPIIAVVSRRKGNP
jgi:hypothetical protein